MSSLPDLATATRTTPSASASPTASSASSTLADASASAVSSRLLSQGPTITGSGTTGQASGATSITGASTATTGGALTGLPKLSGAIQPVTATVPPTANAPFMQQSALPDGTVFIVVGAILGFMAMSVLLWRGLVAWSLHRSVKRASQHQSMADTKALFRTPAAPAPIYKYSDRDSTISLSGLGPKGGKKGGRPTTAGGGQSTSSLFFSPTAGAAGAGLTTPGNRGSNYLPAGHYASGTASAANGQSQLNLGQQPAISLSNLRPESRGYSRARSMGPSPPDSPFIAGQGTHMASSSTLNLNQGYGGNERAPSACLEDLFDGENAPPIPGHRGHARGNSGSPARF